jgi:ABC-type antimicrobial peptide transport system permease subunit
VLRIIGYSRWQILISFLLESLLLAVVGGALGVLLGYAVHGAEQTSFVSGGQGTGKTVVFKMIVDEGVLQTAATFTLVMGLLGGLVPALSAMRQKPLEALR